MRGGGALFNYHFVLTYRTLFGRTKFGRFLGNRASFCPTILLSGQIMSNQVMSDKTLSNKKEAFQYVWVTCVYECVWICMPSTGALVDTLITLW